MRWRRSSMRAGLRRRRTGRKRRMTSAKAPPPASRLRSADLRRPWSPRMLAETFVRSGKVRDLYAVGADRLLLVASDRISAFDVVLPTPIPDKGKVLTGLSRFWFDETSGVVANHLLGTDLGVVDPMDLPDVGDAGGSRAAAAELRGRTMVCQRVDILPIECVVRGYLAGSGLRDYRRGRAISGVRLPPGLREGDRLPEPIFTPSTKAE